MAKFFAEYPVADHPDRASDENSVGDLPVIMFFCRSQSTFASPVAIVKEPMIHFSHEMDRGFLKGKESDTKNSE